MGEWVVARLPATAVAGDLEGAFACSAPLALGWVYQALGRPVEARRAFAEARAAFRTLANHFNVAIAARQELLTVLAYQADRLDERRAAADEAGRAASQGDALPHLDRRALDALARFPLLLLEGHGDEAHRAARPGRQPLPWGEALASAAELAALARREGDDERAWRLVREGLPVGADTAPGTTRFTPARALLAQGAWLALDRGDLATARDWLEAHDCWLAWSGAVLWQAEGALGWAAFNRAAGDRAAACAAAERALALATEPRQPLALLAAHRALGELATDAGRHDEAVSHLDAALALADACAAPYERALTLLALADLRAATGDRAVADTVEEACAILKPLGASPALARAAALHAPPPAPAMPPGSVTSLTARELEVLQLVARGHSNAEVGARLFLSPRTVGQHLRSIYNKLGVENRTAATRLATQHGLVGEGP